ncbi:TolC family protein [candidate division KSB1 bacterium]|nr:TolC family protein [candidate division KSB1 bacterium]
MKLVSRVKMALFLLLVISLSAYTQESMELTVDQCVSLALTKNPEIRMAEKEVAKARASVWEATSNVLPQVSAHAALQHAWDLQTQTIPNFLKPMLEPLTPIIPELSLMPDYVQLTFGLENTLSYGATLTQPLFLGGAGISAIQMAKAGLRAAEQNLESKKQNLIYSSVNAFYSCLLAQELMTVQEEALAQAQANLEVVIKKYNVGMASGFDKMRAQVEAANLKPELISAKNNFQMALTQLRMVLGLDPDAKISVAGEFRFQEDEFGDDELTTLQNAAMKTRPEILAVLQHKTIADKNVALARSNFLPKLFFQTDYSYLGMRNDLRFRQDELSKGFTSGVSLQIPLFTGFRNSKQYQQAKLDKKIMQDTEVQARNAIMAEVEVGYNKFQEAKQKYSAAEESVGLAREALRLANLMYEEGTNTQLDVLVSRLALNRARLNYVSSLYEYQMARYYLRKVTGYLQGVL